MTNTTQNVKTGMDEQSFGFFRDFLRQYSGYHLQDDKRYLLESRVRTLLQEKAMDGVTALVAQLRAQPRSTLAQEFLEAMTINETLFFRDEKLFTSLVATLLPEFTAMGRTRVNIWSAACSYGQEPYSIAMALEEGRAQLPSFDYRITATDINQRVLDRATDGLYTDFELQRGLPAGYAEKYFVADEGGWRIAPPLRESVTFRRQNLQEPFTGIGPFDVIFLRNVLIYFDTPLKEDILNRCWSLLTDGGALALGGSESIAQLNHPFPRFAEPCGYYRKR